MSWWRRRTWRAGTDNITAIFVAGREFLGNASPGAAEARARNAVTKAREDEVAAPARRSVARLLTTRVAFLIYGFVLGTVLALALRWPKP